MPPAKIGNGLLHPRNDPIIKAGSKTIGEFQCRQIPLTEKGGFVFDCLFFRFDVVQQRFYFSNFFPFRKGIALQFGEVALQGVFLHF